MLKRNNETYDFTVMQRKMSDLIDKRIDRQDYTQIAYYTKDKTPFEWPLVEQAVKDGCAAFCVKFEFPEIRALDKSERYRLYGMVRRTKMNTGWLQVYYELYGDTMYVALIRKA
jgi:hypothetical protein